MKDKNSLIYILTIITVIIVYFVIYIFGINLRKNIYLENEGYQNNPSKQPTNSIFSHNDNGSNNSNSYEKAIGFSLYSEQGNYIDLRNQFPTTDEIGKAFEGDKHTHDFKLRLKINAVNTHYRIVARKLDESNLDDDWVKIYLIADGEEVPICFRLNGRVKTFNEYEDYLGNPKEKLLYAGVITPVEAIRGYKDFTFKMWISEDIKVYNEEYLERYFKAHIKVYANGI